MYSSISKRDDKFITTDWLATVRKVPPSARQSGSSGKLEKVVIPTGIDRKYYEFCVLNELKEPYVQVTHG